MLYCIIEPLLFAVWHTRFRYAFTASRDERRDGDRKLIEIDGPITNLKENNIFYIL